MKIKKRLSVLLTGLGLFALTFSANAVDLYCNDLGGCGVSVNCGNSGWCGVEWNEGIGGSIIRCGNGLTTAVVCIAPV